MVVQHFDVIIIGAGLSGIGTACHISRNCPEKSIAILERRERMGGTWDLFKYPGIRSDSDMASFSFKFKPWHSNRVLANGPDILNYVEETAQEHQLEERIQYSHKVTQADWSSQLQLWTLRVLNESSGEVTHFTCHFFINCTGYYNFDQGYSPDFAHPDRFKGTVVHPQHWPEELDYSGKRVVVIGSGATAVTLLPALAQKASHTIMLQRSPSYIMAMPNNDTLAALLNKLLPKTWVYRIIRARNTAVQRGLYVASMRWPKLVRKLILRDVRKRLGEDYDLRHFSPHYNPWEQRLCAAPNGDFFECIKEGKASVVTEHIESFTENGIRLKSGQEIEADIIVTATGLNLQMMGGMTVSIDSQPVELSEKMVYKSVMIQDFPNFAWIFGYTNAPWTLKSDLAGQYLSRLLTHMDKHGYKAVTPVDRDNNRLDSGVIDNFSSGYIQRSRNLLPRQGRSPHWKISMHYGKDKKMLLKQPIADGILQFTGKSLRQPNPSKLFQGHSELSQGGQIS